MKGFFSYKFTLLKENKRYLFFLLLMFLLIFISLFLAFLNRSSSCPPNKNLEETLAEYQLTISSFERQYQNREISYEDMVFSSAKYWYFVKTRTASWNYFDPTLVDPNNKVASSFYSLSTYFFPLFSSLVGLIIGAFCFVSDFSSKRIKNIMSSNRIRKELFKDTIFLSFILIFSIIFFAWLAAFILTLPIHGKMILRQINECVYKESVLKIVIFLLFDGFICSIFFFSLSVFIGLFSKNIAFSFSLPFASCLVFVLLAASISNKYMYKKELICSFLPFSGPLLLLSFGTSVYFYIDLGVYFAISLLLLIFIKRRYERIDV